MKEFNFKSIPGLEESNTPRQLDQFEAKGSKSLKTRYLFDFSIAADFTYASFQDVFQNLTPNGDNWDLYTGSPGQAQLMVKNKKVGPYITSTQPDISSERIVPYWEENCMIYLDEHIPTAFGAGDVANYIKSFRSGYVEFTFKTNKANCILGMGSAKQTDYGVGSNGPKADDTRNLSAESAVRVMDANNAYLTGDYTNTDTMYINLKDGKLELFYQNEFGNTKKEFKINGLTNLADNQWHHVVINFNKPGVLNGHGTKTNKKFIEFWVDGKLEKRYDEYINENQVYFPIIEWLMMNPLLASKVNGEEWESFDRFDNYDVNEVSQYPEEFLGQNEYRLLRNRAFNDIATATAFRGSFNHFISGINFPLSKFEIQQRYRLFNFFDKPAANVFTASANIVDPVVSVNKKRALKLFWNNLINDKAKNGIELDNKYIVDSYSVTHKTINSSTEVNNIDLAPESSLTFLKDVRAVFKDHIHIFGPGKENLYNRSEIWDAQIGEQNQLNLGGAADSIRSISLAMAVDIKPTFSSYSITNLPFSGLTLQDGDRILLTNQMNKKDNGVYVFNGTNETLTRADDAFSANQLKNAVVRVIDGYYKDTSWILSNQISSLSDNQEWIELEYHPSNETLKTQPIFGSRWSNENGIERFIDLEQDLNISKYDLIVFMNYPESNQEVYENFINLQLPEIKRNYQNFIQSLRNVTANGASLYVSSPKLAEDLGIVKKFTYVDQALESSDAQAAILSPFEASEPANKYFDTHRNNKYELATPVTGLTNKETYILTDFINYNPDNNYDYEQYHAKYAYRQLGLQEGNEFFIPGLSLRQVSLNEDLPGFTQNQKRIKPLPVVAAADILTGTVVTKLANTYYNGSTVVNNPYDDYASTIIVRNGQVLAGQPTNGKIFVNCVEDAYTFSREEYNKARIQVVPDGDTNESTATRAWQYSTSRLDRKPKQINIKELTEYGQTTPTNGGGGAFIQAETNSSSGIIRSGNDRNNIDYQSDLYPSVDEERYTTQEIPVLSMTWLGLEWLSE
jgi:hypothetical protein